MVYPMWAMSKVDSKHLEFSQMQPVSSAPRYKLEMRNQRQFGLNDALEQTIQHMQEDLLFLCGAAPLCNRRARRWGG